MALVFDNVYFGQSIDALTDMLAGLGPKDAFRVYAGHAGWAPGQLQGELDLGAWRILRGDSNVVFEKDSAAVWPVMIRRSSEQYIKGFNRPFDQGCLPRPISLSR
jgi:putative transcriptional regulator